jgi:hypothetical protein
MEMEMEMEMEMTKGTEIKRRNEGNGDERS